ncbi:hypothetical protein ALP29_02511 [Pseudomonas syringae pv. avii]|uniref:Uncharacterized protein n=1 Tax=Pseudomonas syringae pv. avii TaxID=663959 RepID=A0A3M5VKM3_PSESX|nr:hypothetical protein ALP29_02511 [Pseudomonas syringae pv. avii]
MPNNAAPGGRAGNQRNISNPSANANIPVFMDHPFPVIHSVLVG